MRVPAGAPLSPVERLLERVADAGGELRERTGERWRGNCPACGGNDRFEVFEDLNGDAGVTCYGGCGRDAILEVLGLSWRDLRAEGPHEPPRNGRLRDAAVDLLAHKPPPLRVEPGLPFLVVGKFHNVAGGTGDGKSLTLLVGCFDAVLAGRDVVILDRENGADTYGERLHKIVKARGLDDAQRAAISERLTYIPFPALPLDTYEDAFEFLRKHGIAIFDSVAKFLPGMELSEDSPADFTKFVEAVIDPLRNAGVTTVVADNVGHEAQNRARGASSKRDHVDVELLLRRAERFDERTRGRIEVRREKSRPGAHHGPWELELGGGHYGLIRGGQAEPLTPSPPFRPTFLMERISRAVEADPGMGARQIRALPGKSGSLDHACQLLIEEGYLRVEQDPGRGRRARHYAATPFRAPADGAEQAAGDRSNDDGQTGCAARQRSAPPSVPLVKSAEQSACGPQAGPP